MKDQLLFFLTLCIVACAVFASPSRAARTEAISAAIDAVNAFYTESDAITKDFVPEGFKGSSLAQRDRAVKELKAVEWTEEPSERRGQRIRSVASAYMTERIGLIEKELMAAGNEKDDKKRLEAIGQVRSRLNGLKDELLSRLDSALTTETREKKEIKPVPIIDRPPQEPPAPEDAPGIWYR